MDDLPTHTVQEYVIIEEFSGLKHEYDDGQVRAMSGGTAEHARLAAEVIFQLKTKLVGRACGVFTSDLRVRVSASGLITYPDVSVFCGELTADSEDKLAQRNPTVLVEVASKSTENYDRTTKFEHYKRIPTLREYVIVSYREHAIDVFRRADDGTWSLAERGVEGEHVSLSSIGCTLDVGAVYLDPMARPT